MSGPIRRSRRPGRPATPICGRAEAALPAVTYRDIFRDPRLQALIEQALANNRDLMVAAANIAAAREQYRIQRADQFPQVDASAGATRHAATRTTSVERELSGRRRRPELRARPVRPAALADRRPAATAISRPRPARARRGSTLVADIANAWLDLRRRREPAARSPQDTAASAEKSVAPDPRPARRRHRAAHRPAPGRADPRQRRGRSRRAAHRAGAGRQPAAAAGRRADRPGAAAAARSRRPRRRSPSCPPGSIRYVLLRRPDVVEAEYQLRAANAEIGAARAALFPRISLTGLLGLASTALAGLFSGGLAWSAGADATYTIFEAGAGRANVRLTEAERDAAVATYQKAIQTAFREVADALARQGTIGEQLRARRAQHEPPPTADRLTEARYRDGIDSFLASLDAQRSYSAQRPGAEPARGREQSRRPLSLARRRFAPVVGHRRLIISGCGRAWPLPG